MARISLYFDIGNTNCKVGLALAGEPLVTYALPTDERQTADQFGLVLLGLLQHRGFSHKDVGACVASSVVPGMGQLVSQACSRFFGLALYFVPEDIPVPLENRYARPHEVGADRLVGAYAARQCFPASPAIICVDFGTATTFDCVQGNAYIGGLICPGVLSSLAALATKTARLPQVSLDTLVSAPEPGRSTVTSISHGFMFGFACMAEGLCQRLASTLEGPVAVVATGGFATALAKITQCFDTVQPDLLLEGLRLLHEDVSAVSATNTNKGAWK